MSGAGLLGLVLAGGRSSRMGEDKANLVHPDGQPLALRTAALLREAGCGEVLLSLRAEQPPPAGFEDRAEETFVRDPAEGGGPMVGMLAAMRARPEADWLIAACDLPRLDAATLRHLAERAEPDEPWLSYRSEHDGLPEPLCALYRAAARDALEAALAEGLRCPRKVLIRGGCRLLEPLVAGALANANTPDDWREALAEAAEKRLRVLYLGLLSERRGLAAEELRSAALTAGELYRELAARHALGLAAADVKLAVNDELVDPSRALAEGDEVALLPPMSGG